MLFNAENLNRRAGGEVFRGGHYELGTMNSDMLTAMPCQDATQRFHGEAQAKPATNPSTKAA